MAVAPGGVSEIAAPDFAELFAALPMAVLVVDDGGCIAHANAEAEALLNQSERAMIGQPLHQPHRAAAGRAGGAGAVGA